MKLLAIDSSGLTASVAVISDGVILSEYSVNNKKTHSQTLLPMIDEVVKQSGIELNQLDAVAIAEGPGSFTGLRIGAATIKGFGLALNIPVVPVSTLTALAYNMAGCSGIICPIMDARRSQVYTAAYRCEESTLISISEPEAVAIDDVINKYKSENIVWFTGDGVKVHEDRIRSEMGNRARFAPAHMRLQRAASIAVLGEILFEEGKTVLTDIYKPVYLRLSQAERERLEARSTEQC